MTDFENSSRSPTELLATLRQLRSTVAAQGAERVGRWSAHIDRRAGCLSATNMADYLALRSVDLRPLQPLLSRFGISSLGRAEGRVLANLDAVIAALEAICGAPDMRHFPREQRLLRGVRMLHHNSEQVFGAEPVERSVRVMVTYPSEAAQDYDFVRDLVVRGMDCARINCAHDDATQWGAMISYTHQAAAEVGRNVKILMDLGGPKVRTQEVTLHKKRLFTGDALLLRRDAPSKDSRYVNQVRCSLPEVIDQLAVGQAVWMDDGKIGAVITQIEDEGALLRITHVEDEGARLRDEKGLNFPDTLLNLSPLTPDDLSALDFVVHHADMIGYSFVQNPDDIDLLQREMAARRADWQRVAIIAKIETRRAIHNLPDLIVRAMGKQPFGVMIARGDLAVEVGYQRMAEIQEQILWLCEAAHVPVIWATQVMESFVKKGTPSRGEMTDAAMSARAECVMLNKGPHVGEAISILNDLLSRMQGHQLKKTPQLRQLKVWADVLRD